MQQMRNYLQGMEKRRSACLIPETTMASHPGPESGTIWGAEGLGGFLPFGQQTVFGYRDVVPPDVAVLWSLVWP